jgi:signal transduction histidine kinase
MFNIHIKLDDKRKDVFRFFSYFTGITFYIIAILHFALDKWIFFGVVDFFLGSLVFINYLFFREKSFSMDILNLQFIIVSILLVMQGGLYETGIYWVIGFPAVFFISSGVKKGIIYSLIEISILVMAIILKELNIIDVFYSIGQLAFAILVVSILATAVYIYEYNIEKQYEKQQALISEIRSFNISLQEKVDNAITEIQEKDQLILTQSRFAVMGEMLSMIAHQWRQPLNSLSLILMNMDLKIELKETDTKEFKDSMAKAEDTIQHLSKTIDDFRELINPIKNEFTFSVENYIKKSLSLNESQMINHNIKVNLITGNDFNIVGKANEFLQVVLNLMSNSKDALEEIENREITIYIENNDKKNYIHFCDNGVGIKEENSEKIFEPYFSTKSKNGTGIGLYMSRVIIEKMNGKIYYKKVNNKTCFILEFDEGDIK